MKLNFKKTKTKGCDEKGFTMAEVLVATFLFPLLFLTIFSLLDMANVISRTNDVFAQLNQSAMQLLRYIGRELGETSPNISPSHLTITTDTNGNSVVTFQIPVDHDNDGDVIVNGTDNQVTWGAYNEAGETQDGRLNAWVRYSVVNSNTTNPQLIREVLDSTQTLIPGLSRVVANNISQFTVTQSPGSNMALTTVTLNATDRTGQAGGARILQARFSNNTVLRNAVD